MEDSIYLSEVEYEHNKDINFKEENKSTISSLFQLVKDFIQTYKEVVKVLNDPEFKGIISEYNSLFLISGWTVFVKLYLLMIPLWILIVFLFQDSSHYDYYSMIITRPIWVWTFVLCEKLVAKIPFLLNNIFSIFDIYFRSPNNNRKLSIWRLQITGNMGICLCLNVCDYFILMLSV